MPEPHVLLFQVARQNNQHLESSIPKDQNDQGPRHPGHMGEDTLGCRVGCSGVEMNVWKVSINQHQLLSTFNQYGIISQHQSAKHPLPW